MEKVVSGYSIRRTEEGRFQPKVHLAKKKKGEKRKICIEIGRRVMQRRLKRNLGP